MSLTRRGTSIKGMSRGFAADRVNGRPLFVPEHVSGEESGADGKTGAEEMIEEA